MNYNYFEKEQEDVSNNNNYNNNLIATSSNNSNNRLASKTLSLTFTQWMNKMSELYIAQIYLSPPSNCLHLISSHLMGTAHLTASSGGFVTPGLTTFSGSILPSFSLQQSFYSCWSQKHIVRDFGAYVPRGCIDALHAIAEPSLDDIVSHLLFLCNLKPNDVQVTSDIITTL
jgi:hypothetical protein